MPDSRYKDNIFCLVGRFYALVHHRLLSRHRDLGNCNSKICISCVATHAYLHGVFCACCLMPNGYLQKGPTVIIQSIYANFNFRFKICNSHIWIVDYSFMTSINSILVINHSTCNFGDFIISIFAPKLIWCYFLSRVVSIS